MAQEDSDQWVAMVGDILKTYPSAGTLNTEGEHRHNFYHEVLADLRKLGTWMEVLFLIFKNVYLEVKFNFFSFSSKEMRQGTVKEIKYIKTKI